MFCLGGIYEQTQRVAADCISYRLGAITYEAKTKIRGDSSEVGTTEDDQKHGISIGGKM